MGTHSICFYGEITKIIPKLSSKTLICSAAQLKKLARVMKLQR